MKLRPYRSSAIVLLTLHLSACGAGLTGSPLWLPSTVSPRQLIEEQHPVFLRVTMTDSTQVDLVYPAVEGDSISGNPPEGCELGHGCDDVRVMLALADVTAVETWGTPEEASELAALLEPAEPEPPSGFGEQLLVLVFLVGGLTYLALDFLCGDDDACYGAGF